VGLPGGIVDSFEYDANGLRTKKVDGTGTTRYLLDGPSVVAEYDENGARKGFYVNNPQRIDEVFSATVLFNGQPTKVYPLTDALGSDYALVDRNGTVVQTNSYDVYGARTSTGTGPQLAMGFTGREHDESRLNYHRDRYLMPGVGRWTQADRLGIDADGPNLYRYAEGNPTRATDPSGALASLAMAKVVAGIASDLALDAAMQWLHLGTKQECDPDSEPTAALAFAEFGYLLLLGVLAMVVANTGGDGTPKELFKSIKDSPKYPKDFVFRGAGGMTRPKVGNRDLLEQLRTIERGDWRKVYKDGYSGGSKISIHYFESPSGKVFDVEVWSGWSNP
jgi:RHS repeat-associated protein